ncbi:MAG: type I citrate synthase [Candidatus Marinimicrobia bacterium]|nr:type I citrate synthase [Candidatus Neomarinimicrobiota bacterium]|tara:strand:- start:8186 stop:9451 length:1266 start_codon:yes stop_codon:yes gene_type:complete
MGILKQNLAKKIPDWRYNYRQLLDEKGDHVTSTVTIEKAFSGMRGVKGIICDTSSVTADAGLHVRGHHILDLIHIKPEEVLYLMLIDELPDKKSLKALQQDLQARSEVPDYVWDVLNSMPKDSHPMAMFNTAILCMQKESKFAKAYELVVSKSDYWESTLDDGLNIIAKLPAIAAAVYRLRFNKGERIESNNDLDWSGNFLHMMGFDQSKDMLKMMQLYLMLHCDHEGGNVSTFSSLTVNSALSDPYYSLSAGLNGLAGPLHGLANQNNLKFVLEVVEHFKGVPSDKELKEFVWDRLNSGRVIPGYGHAVLRCPDPRFTAFMGFGNKHIKDCDVFSVVTKLFNIVPDILKQHGKAKNPWPNVDAASGSLLYHYGLKEFEFYTVLFSMSRSLGIVSQMVLSRAMGLPLTRPKSLTFDALNKL